MRIIVKATGMPNVRRFGSVAKRLADGTWKTEAMLAVSDAGRKTKTQVQRAVFQQMALKGGTYQRHVVAGTRGISVRKRLAYQIYGVPGGQRVEEYKGLRVLKGSGKVAARMNAGRKPGDEGTVRSDVWNVGRVFKRSFSENGGYFALLPPGSGGSGRAPKALWTFGHKPNQPRDAGGRFGKSGIKYGRIRRLFGPSLRKEIPKDQSLATFLRVGPVFLEEAVDRRIGRIIRF